uniref:F-BAR domain-containing protein n=1 Tax=Anisakis simplex TaxID=6269 RepID=A0A0M3JKJ8_ANISI
LVEERMRILVDRYAELQELSEDRKRRLENNRRLCQFWWDVAELEQNLKESEQVRKCSSQMFLQLNRFSPTFRDSPTSVLSKVQYVVHYGHHFKCN